MVIRFTCVLLYVILFGILIESSAQQRYNQTGEFLKANSFWAFFEKNGLRFSGSVPMPSPTSIAARSQTGLRYNTFSEGACAVSDPISGDLLFYSDGRRVWNRNHQLMPNGDSLYGNFQLTTVQGVCAVPVIGEASKYYLFSLGGPATDNGPDGRQYRGLYYSIIDMSLDGGNGDIKLSEKNISVDAKTLFTEAMISIPGDECNIWLILHKADSKEYLAYEINSNGVNLNPVISIGREQSHVNGVGYTFSVSPDRQCVAFLSLISPYYGATTYGRTVFSELLKFDVARGKFSSAISLAPHVASIAGTIFPLYGFYTSAFSPNGEVLYLIEQLNILGGAVLLSQMNLSIWDSASITNSHEIIDTLFNAIYGTGYYASLKSYKDTVYVFCTSDSSIGMICNPDSLGLACDLRKKVIQLPQQIAYEAAPYIAEIVYPFGQMKTLMDTQKCHNLIMDGYTLTIVSGRAKDEVVWNNGATGDTLTIYKPGKFWVTYPYFFENCLYQRTDTLIVNKIEMHHPTVTVRGVDVLGVDAVYESYQWIKDGWVIENATKDSLVVNQNGRYQVAVVDRNGCTDTSDVYNVTNQDVSIDFIVNGSSVQVYPNPAKDIINIKYDERLNVELVALDGKVISYLPATSSVSLLGLKPGIYILKIIDKYGTIFYRKIVKDR